MKNDEKQPVLIGFEPFSEAQSPATLMDVARGILDRLVERPELEVQADTWPYAPFHYDKGLYKLYSDETTDHIYI